ncbi:5,10-methylenetetrahydrofolate dehydrogenase (NADP+) [Polaribacter sp. Hel1_33_78]|jgi:methylenetetrahydrofolate dehydrogenase (NADP+)/methenyltetrahydrofolate cyclohydrolase|uniref:bifunctional methylenetetrahydrofolate dehydrogenase/methenyltetrahydrofolate cyclohydrolase FolD n=1 Tax=unclassified Polaribacter TaxID=196858 RepID=UPI00052E28A6|nr:MULTISPECIES: bifunctional methylenetetrahydrofolate dehydrogenase/methenyltetrahydrofolate cyclohydrolase FolD [unclassified Polaribacter]KGL61164.1 methylenetetrahydrofolate dehydrogenase (NADP+) / methenyltetrahydrofolate cyclohydrolase [Polaribacter sp. Hel1_33_49]MBT3742227.1 bifunctional methylenetetrahydrofolate dehydrogenase/methenyltetrahydrofolate cyclohydrolase FolD [Polaribacter sp.]MBT4413097.1 bifunctional methylenetetrahydrofolate dehydrogenase/methenyltetrahydrofolate cyclohyd
MILLDGKKTSADIKEEIALEVRELKNRGNKTPHLAAVIVGNDGASITYVNAKVKACERVGFESTLIRLPKETSEEDLLNEIAILNIDNDIDGFIVQLPLPKHINEQKVIMAIDPNKDVDGFHPTNVGKMALNLPTFISATPFGILELLDRYNVETSGKHVVVLGRSHIVGSPMSILLSQKRKVGNATVTMCHSRTKNLKEITLQADIIVAAIGIPEFVKAEMVKDNVTIIDVGITRLADSSRKNGFRLVGDVAFDEVSKKAAFITPVPGGVGPMTIAMLLKNTLLACQRKN